MGKGEQRKLETVESEKLEEKETCNLKKNITERFQLFACEINYFTKIFYVVFSAPEQKEIINIVNQMRTLQ